MGLNAMYIESMVQFDTIEQTFATFKDKSKVFDHRMARIPSVNDDDSIGEAIGGSAVYMFDKGDSVKKTASWEFVKFLASTDVSAYWYVQSGYFPLNNDALKTKYVADCWKKTPNKTSMIKVRSDSVNTYKFQEPWIPGYYFYDTAIINECMLIGQGKRTVDQAVNSISKKASDTLATYARANK
jgi:ABC-type glycerol-3-phosphate transport system substrate-binding protein